MDGIKAGAVSRATKLDAANAAKLLAENSNDVATAVQAFQRSLKPPIMANVVPAKFTDSKPATPTTESAGNAYVEGFSEPHPDFCGTGIGQELQMDPTMASTGSERSGVTPKAREFDPGRFTQVVSLGARPLRYCPQPHLSVHISAVTNIKASALCAVEVLVDDKSSVRSGWHESGNFKTTFEFDRFHMLRSYLRVVLWQKRKITSVSLQREDSVMGECVIALAELEDVAAIDAPGKVRFLNIKARPLSTRDKLGGPRLFAEVLMTIPRIGSTAPARVAAGVQTEEIVELRARERGKTPVETAPSTLIVRGETGEGLAEKGGTVRTEEDGEWPPWPE